MPIFPSPCYHIFIRTENNRTGGALFGSSILCIVQASRNEMSSCWSASLLPKAHGIPCHESNQYEIELPSPTTHDVLHKNMNFIPCDCLQKNEPVAIQIFGPGVVEPLLNPSNITVHRRDDSNYAFHHHRYRSTMFAKLRFDTPRPPQHLRVHVTIELMSDIP